MTVTGKIQGRVILDALEKKGDRAAPDDRGLIDNTFTAIVLRAPHDVPIPGREWVYYRHPEHGGIIDEPLNAARMSIDPGLWLAEDWAKRYFPDRDWKRARLVVEVKPFDSDPATMRAIDANVADQLRRRAIAKLDDQEKRALGIDDDFRRYGD